MASPFSMFRKNQKVMIAILGILCMVAFVILPNINRMTGSGAPRNPVAVTTKYGDIRELELENLVRARIAVNQFLAGAIEMAVATMGREGTITFGMEPQMMQLSIQGLQRRGLMSPASESSVVETMILAKKAEEMGLVISDAAINSFLNDLTDNKVSPEQFDMILDRIRLAESGIFDALQIELMASRLLETFQIGLNGLPPAQRWDYYQRFKLQATIEAAPIEVASFVDQVSDPDDDTLLEFYERYKNQYAAAGSPEPGFHQPARAKFQYFKAEYEKLVDESAISDEQVETYYQENRETRFRNRSQLVPPGALFEPDEEPDATEPDADAETDAEPGQPAPSSEPAPPQEEQPDAAPGSLAPDASQTEEDTAAEKPSEEAPPEPASPSPNGQSAREDRPGDSLALADAADLASGGTSGEGRQLLLALVQEDPASQPSGEPDEGNESSPPAGESPSSDEASSDSADDASAPGDEPPTSGSNSPDDSSPFPSDSQSAEPRVQLPSEFVLPLDVRDLPEWEYQPFWAVQNQIRRQLARQAAAEEIDKAFGQLTEEMNAYYDKILDWDDARQENPDAPRPELFNMPLLADRYRVISRETGLLTAQEVSESSDVGKSFVRGSSPFATYVFENVRLYDPTRSQDFEGNQYLFWKLEEKADYVPEIEEVRDTVVGAWKLVQARKPGRLHAEELAQRARSSSRSFAETFSDDALDVIQAGPFSWLTFGTVDPFSFNQTPPRISEVTQIDQPGDEFMREVFRLETEQIGVAMNAPQTVVYIVRVTSLEPGDEELQKTFLNDSLGRYAMAGRAETFEAYRSWLDQLTKEAGLDWVRAPDARIRR